MQSAQTKARTELTKLFPEDYSKFYKEERKNLSASKNSDTIRSAAQNRAKTRLCQKYKVAYDILYSKYRDEGYPLNMSRKAISA